MQKNRRFGRLVENRCQTCLSRYFSNDISKLHSDSAHSTSADYTATSPPTDRVHLSAQKKATANRQSLVQYRGRLSNRSTRTRPAAEAESRPKGGCYNRRLSGLMGDGAKIYFQTQSHSKHGYLRSKQQPTIDKSAEAQQADRVPLSAQKKATANRQSLVRIKGLEPPRLSAPDPKSGVATNYTISAFDASAKVGIFL